MSPKKPIQVCGAFSQNETFILVNIAGQCSCMIMDVTFKWHGLRLSELLNNSARVSLSFLLNIEYHPTVPYRGMNIYYFIQLTFAGLSMNISMSFSRKGDSHEHGFEAGQLSNS
jgi:hypothetical protein